MNEEIESKVVVKSKMTPKDRLHLIVMSLFIAVLLMMIWIGYINWKYKAEFLVTPCELCAKLNPQYNECFDYAGLVIKDAAGNIIAEGKAAKEFLDREEQWTYPNYSYNFSGVFSVNES